MGLDKISRVQGCLFGRHAGDVLDSLVEFLSPEGMHVLFMTDDRDRYIDKLFARLRGTMK